MKIKTGFLEVIGITLMIVSLISAMVVVWWLYYFMWVGLLMIIVDLFTATNYHSN